MRCYWDEDDIWFYFEVDEAGMVMRQVELQGTAQTALAAASVDEWQQAQDAGCLTDYEQKYGFTAEMPVSEWEGHNPEQLTSTQFEEIWAMARRQIAARPA